MTTNSLLSSDAATCPNLRTIAFTPGPTLATDVSHGPRSATVPQWRHLVNGLNIERRCRTSVSATGSTAGEAVLGRERGAIGHLGPQSDRRRDYIKDHRPDRPADISLRSNVRKTKKREG